MRKNKPRFTPKTIFSKYFYHVIQSVEGFAASARYEENVFTKDKKVWERFPLTLVLISINCHSILVKSYAITSAATAFYDKIDFSSLTNNCRRFYETLYAHQLGLTSTNKVGVQPSDS